MAVFTDRGSIVHPLPIAVLISDKDWREVARRSREVGRLLQNAGCHLPYPFMTFSLLALVVIAELRLSDRGLIRIGEKGLPAA
ncbi:MAG: hypothetical protein KM310_04720 [Clostridiales bacterium]|nr:hypothetical protein [Clostridiales bacterium]